MCNRNKEVQQFLKRKTDHTTNILLRPEKVSFGLVFTT